MEHDTTPQCYEATLLYVEDEPEIRDAFVDFFERRFTSVYVAGNGEEGLRLYMEHAPSLIVTDVRMPGLNGIEMIQAIRKIDAEVPIIVLSAYADADFLIDSVREQISGRITKPIDRQKLLAMIAGVMQQDPLPTPVSEASLLVVGIGASAGGLEALSALVKGLPRDSGMTYVIAQHLSPTHKTMLVDLLSRETDLQVMDVAHGEPLRKKSSTSHHPTKTSRSTPMIPCGSVSPRNTPFCPSPLLTNCSSPPRVTKKSVRSGSSSRAPVRMAPRGRGRSTPRGDHHRPGSDNGQVRRDAAGLFGQLQHRHRHRPGADRRGAGRPSRFPPCKGAGKASALQK